MRIARRAGMSKAKVALARKLAVIMHRMLVDGKPFNSQLPRHKRRDQEFSGGLDTSLPEAKSPRRDEDQVSPCPPVAL